MPQRTSVMWRTIATPVILVVLFLGVLLGLPPWATVIVVTALVLAGAWEWSAFLRPSGIVARVGYVALVAVLLLGAFACLLDTIGLALDHDDLCTMHQSVNKGDDASRVRKHLMPFAKRSIGRDHR